VKLLAVCHALSQTSRRRLSCLARGREPTHGRGWDRSHLDGLASRIGRLTRAGTGDVARHTIRVDHVTALVAGT
jgi:hypothetical protein